MDVPEMSLAAWLTEIGALKYALLLAVACTGWLVIGRVRGIYKIRKGLRIRDISFLLAGPIIAVLVSIAAVASGERILRQGGLDVNWALADHVAIAASFCRVALVCFAAGLLSFLLPKKQGGAEQSARGD